MLFSANCLYMLCGIKGCTVLEMYPGGKGEEGKLERGYFPRHHAKKLNTWKNSELTWREVLPGYFSKGVIQIGHCKYV